RHPRRGVQHPRRREVHGQADGGLLPGCALQRGQPAALRVRQLQLRPGQRREVPEGGREAGPRSGQVVQQRRDRGGEEDRHRDDDLRAQHLQVLRGVPAHPGRAGRARPGEAAGRAAQVGSREPQPEAPSAARSERRRGGSRLHQGAAAPGVPPGDHLRSGREGSRRGADRNESRSKANAWVVILGLAAVLAAAGCKPQETAAAATPAPTAVVAEAAPTPAATVPGPVADTRITEAYARMVARDAYFWSWPMVNVYNRRLTFGQLPEPGLIGGTVPAGPVNTLAMLSDYVDPAERAVACPNQDVVYGIALLGLDVEPIVIQVPD